MMITLLEFREQLKNFYAKFEVYITPLYKFLVSLTAFLLINQNMGYLRPLKNPAIAIILALLCSFLPMNFAVFFAGLLILGHAIGLSLEAGIVILCVELLILMLYLRLSPKSSFILLLTPIAFALKVPYVIPISVGLVSAPVAALPVGCGVAVYYMIDLLKTNASALSNSDAESMLTRISLLVNGIIDNKAMLLTIAAFTITIMVVYIIRRLSVDYAWGIAIGVGAITDIFVLLIGDFVLDVSNFLLMLIVGSLVAVLVALVLHFFLFSVDYSRTERVQFEDDEYYYYVKAVPKMSVTTRKKQIKKINAKKDDRRNERY